jgi:hypothetical protein
MGLDLVHPIDKSAAKNDSSSALESLKLHDDRMCSPRNPRGKGFIPEPDGVVAAGGGHRKPRLLYDLRNECSDLPGTGASQHVRIYCGYNEIAGSLYLFAGRYSLSAIADPFSIV